MENVENSQVMFLLNKLKLFFITKFLNLKKFS